MVKHKNIYFPFHLFLLFLTCLLSAPESSADSKTIIAGVPANFPPHYSIDKQTGKPVGFAIEVMDEIAAQSGFNVKYIVYDTWNKVLQAINTGDIDLIPNLGITDERTSYLDFTTPVEAFHIKIFVRNSTANILRIEDLEGHTVAVVKTNKGHDLMKDHPGVTLQIHYSLEEALVALLSGNAEALIYPEPPVKIITRSLGIEDNIKTVGKSILEVKRAIAVKKGHPELLEQLDAAVKELLNSGKYQGIYAKWYGREKPFWTPGRVFWVMIFLLVLAIVGALFMRYVTLLRFNRALQASIKEREKTEKDLRESESRFRSMFEDNHSVMILVDPQTTEIIDANPAAAAYYGYTKKELINKKMTEINLLTPEKLFQEIKRAQKKERWQFFFKHRLANGEIRDVEVYSGPIIIQSKECLFSIIHDISDRTKAELELLKNKEEWEKTFNSISDIVTILDPDLRIVRANKAACRSINLRCDEIIGKHCYEVFYGASEPCFGCPDIESIRDKGQQSAEIMHPQLDKTFLVSIEPIFANDGTFEGAVHIARDITEQKKLEGQFRQAQKMEAIGTLAGGIAHDFNNILAAIMGYTDIAKYEVSADSELSKYLDEIMAAGKRAKDMVKQILAFSRQSDQEKMPIHLHHIIKESLKLLRASIPANIEIKQNIDTHCGAVLADPTQVHQIMMNLCTNAYHAMRKTGGTLGVSLVGVEITADDINAKMDLAPGSYVRLEVSDTGHGMDQALIERIFEPYFTTKEKGEGTGMGLSVVHGIVKSHGGTITVDSTLGVGTTFHVYFPGIESAGSIEIQKAITPLPRGTEKILIVDDEEPLVFLLQQMLESLGYAVTSFTDSSKALKTFTNQPDYFDLVVTDMNMPKMTGAAFSRKLLTINPHIPIILCTGFSDTINEEHAMAMGIKRYLMKPIIKHEISNAVREVLDQEKPYE
ncbi:MAG: transporter substrate-binding domain-containing protein [Proteobacteria bacterium]|nr:transporter substrate-binding domain-containing protein [Pseudomonadota bacterium]MBU1710360.1 transporter substrate-binding domain-containing protein [Pseudomonadota bacterium]